MWEPEDEIRHVLVVFDGSAAAHGALQAAVAMAAPRDAALTVVTLVEHERQSVGCCVPAAAWNRELDAMVSDELSQARRLLGARAPSARFAAVEGVGPAGVRRAAEGLGCDLVLVPARGPLPQRLARRCRRAGCPRVIGVRARRARVEADMPAHRLPDPRT